MDKEEFEFELAKKQTEILLLIAKELCNIRQVLEGVAPGERILSENDDWEPETDTGPQR